MGIKLYNIYTSKIEEENVCAENTLRFLYESQLGSVALWAVFKRRFFSRLCGFWANSKRSAKTAANFIADNKIDIAEFKNPPSSFKTFNEFFTRELVDTARPLAKSDNSLAISFPSDGRHLLIENVSLSNSFYAKGCKFNLASFLGDDNLARRFENASMLISRLSPLDYHRFHYPISGELVARREIGGSLFSVSPIALSRRLEIFWQNARVLNIIESPEFGMCAFVEIGATNVGEIINFHKLGERVARGQQAGMFKFGGSCVVTIIPAESKINWREKLVEMSAQNIECYAKVNALAGVKE